MYEITISPDKTEIEVTHNDGELDISPIENPAGTITDTAITTPNGQERLPIDPPVRSEISQWVADQSVPDEQQLAEAIERLADLEANNFQVVWESE